MPIPTPEELRMLRLKTGLTQAEVARRAGVSQSLIARIESGKVNPRVSTLMKIYQALSELVEDELTARDIMSSPVIYVEPRTPLVEATRIMWERGFSQLPVLQDGVKNVGTIFEDDVLHAFLRESRRAANLTVADVMSDPLPLVNAETRIGKVTRLLSRGIPAVLVESDMRIVGIIAKSDIAKLLLGRSL
ncbi:MAG: CBS domain-containing protein [Thermofilum sp.]|uniref:CBS domain-containing protein n=1 Tax=Thermofilum pendens TaxID=2269 RepID=A0A7C4D448_THEPE